MRAYEKEMIDTLTEHLTEWGFQVYIAERGTYGFFTDDSGERVVSFQCDFGTVKFTGNYHASRESGTGWEIGTKYPQNPEDARAMLNAPAPRWANTNPIYTTRDEHVAIYGPSSHYTKA